MSDHAGNKSQYDSYEQTLCISSQAFCLVGLVDVGLWLLESFDVQEQAPCMRVI